MKIDLAILNRKFELITWGPASNSEITPLKSQWLVEDLSNIWIVYYNIDVNNSISF